jgi:hypothetical protein
LRDSYIGLYDDKNGIAFAFKFQDIPEWGNIGALGNRQIDAVRFLYQFGDLKVNQAVERSYQVLTMSKNSFPGLEPSSLQGLFDSKPSDLKVTARDFTDYIEQNNIGFIVYDRNHLDTNVLNSRILQLIYSNDRYDIFKIIR